MAIFSKSKSEVQNDNYWVKKNEDSLNSSKNSRGSTKELQWMVNLAWYKGLQNMQFDQSTNRVLWGRYDPTKFYINKIMPTVRAVRGLVTKYKPTFQVEGLPIGQFNTYQNRAVANYMLSLEDELELGTVDKKVVFNGLMYGVGYYIFGYDKGLNDNQGGLWVEAKDAFDVYLDPTASMDSELQYFNIVSKKGIDALKKNKAYKNQEKIKPDGRLAESTYKENISVKNQSQTSTNVSSDSVLVNQGFYLVNEKGKEFVRIVTTAGNVLLGVEDTELTRLPIIPYEPDVNPGEIGGEGWVKHLIPINRTINALEKNTAEYHDVVAKGRYIRKGNGNMSTITNQNGQIISVEPGANIDQLDIKPMTSSVFDQLSGLNRYYEDISGTQEIMLGRAPQGVTAAIAFEQLVANNMNVFADLIDNFEIARSKLGERLLDLAYQHFNTTRWFKYTDSSGEESMASVIGNSPEAITPDMLNTPDGEPVPVIRLPDRAKVRVKIVSGIAYTRAGKMETLFKLRSNGDISRKTLLEQLDLDAAEEKKRIDEETTPPPSAQPAQAPIM